MNGVRGKQSMHCNDACTFTAEEAAHAGVQHAAKMLLHMILQQIKTREIETFLQTRNNLSSKYVCQNMIDSVI